MIDLQEKSELEKGFIFARRVGESRKSKNNSGKPSVIQNHSYIFNLRVDGRQTRMTLWNVNQYTYPIKIRALAKEIRGRAILGEEFRPKVQQATNLRTKTERKHLSRRCDGFLYQVV